MFCREQMANGFRCGLKSGHVGPHECCSLHRPRAEQWSRTSPGFDSTREAYEYAGGSDV